MNIQFYDMGIRDWFAKKSGRIRSVHAPSAEYPTARAAIEAILRAYPNIGENEDWITFEAEGAGKQAIIEVADRQVNFCTVKMDLRKMLQDAGLSALAEPVPHADGWGKDKTLWKIEKVSTDTLIEIVDYAFAKPLGLGESYKLKAMHQD